MINAFVLTAADNAQIKDAETRAGSKDCWDDDELYDLKWRIKEHYIHEQQHRCAYCRRHIMADHHQIWWLDHIVPRSTHPQFTFEMRNIVAACIECNAAKGDSPSTNRAYVRFPRSARAFILFNEYFHSYPEHITRMGDFFYEARSSEGSYTINTCKLWRFFAKHMDIDPLIFGDAYCLMVFNLFSKNQDTRQQAHQQIGAILAATP